MPLAGEFCPVNAVGLPVRGGSGADFFGIEVNPNAGTIWVKRGIDSAFREDFGNRKLFR